jgi:hypothetical protein
MANTTFNQSSKYTGITWDYGSVLRTPPAAGSDLWHIAWAHDGNLYATWGDGYGFGGVNSYTNWGIARIEGATYTARSGYNVYGGDNQESSEYPQQPTTGGDPNWKMGNIFCVKSVLYGTQFGRSYVPANDYIQFRILHSHDLGLTWRMTNQASVNQGTWDVSSAKFASARAFPYLAPMGQNHQNNVYSGYVHGFAVASNSDFYCCRAPENDINNLSAYELRTGSGTWVWFDNVNEADKMFEHSFVEYEFPDMFYLPTQDRWFISFQTIKNDPHWYAGSATANFHLLDSPDPWGPWTKVGIWNDFIDAQFKFTFTIPDKWVNSATGGFKMLWSGISSNDNFCSIGGTFNYTTAPGSTAPNSYSVSSWSTYTGSQSWVKEVDGADIADYTLMHTAIADQIIAGQIAAGAIGAAEIAADTVAVKHLVVGDYTNAIPNPAFKSGDDSKWSLPSGCYVTSKGGAAVYPSGVPTPWVVVIGNGGVVQCPSSVPIDCAPGESYFVGVDNSAASDNNGDGFAVGVKLYDRDGAYMADAWTASRGGGIGGVSWMKTGGIFAVSSGARGMAFVARYTGTNCCWNIAQPRIRKAAEGELIVDGAITAAKVGANEIVAQTANIKDAVVTTLKIGENAVTIPVYSYVSSYIYFANSAILAQLAVTNHGNPLQLTFHATIYMDPGFQLSFNYKRSDSSSVWGVGRIENNGGTVLVAPIAVGWSDAMVSSGAATTLYLYGSLTGVNTFTCAMPIFRSVEMRR